MGGMRLAGLCSPAPAHRIQPARRRQPHRAPARPREGAGHDALRHHRPRRDVRRGRLLRSGQEARHPSRHRLRGLHLRGHGRPAQRRAQSPDSAVRESEGLCQPRQARQRGLDARVLLQAARGHGAIARAQRGADRAVGVPLGRAAQAAAGWAHGGRLPPRAADAGAVRQGQLLHRDHGSRPARPEAGAAAAGAGLAAHGHPHGRDQRLPLPAP